ncbi:MAG: cytochrome c oxidase subunit 1 [Gammaproteobacteria bacterium]|nr:cytochrome c oxidase subunit 1 [Gammaproteobacteria bacterium]
MNAAHAHDAHHDEHPRGFSRWLFTTNHKDIGRMYIIFSVVMFLVGGMLAMLIRTELLRPWLLIPPEVYNQIITVHGLVMVFAAVMPATTGLANYLIPMMIGAPDMALPRLNNWGFWLLPPAAVLLVMPFALEMFGIGNGAIDTGWTMYAPLSVQGGIGVDFAIFAVYLMGISSLLSSINIIVTILNLRAPGMSFGKLPIFVWSWLITAFLLVAVFPPLMGGVTMLFADRHFGTHFFNAAGGGDPVLWEHIFWFFGHPEVYILLLPTAGILPHVLSTFARKPVYGYNAQVYSFWAIGLLSVVVYAHHMFTSGLPVPAQLYFMYSTMAISVPVAVLFFCWFATIWQGSMTFETPMLFALGYIVLFGVGGLTGLILSDAVADQQYHNSYFLVAHFHYALFGGPVMGIIAATYYYLPKITGRMYNETLGKWHFWQTLIGFNLTFIPQFFLGIAGMPRRIPDYALQFAHLNMLSSIGAYILGSAQLVLVYNLIQVLRGVGKKATAQVWEGAQGLEFTVPSPPPYHTFETQPVIP